MDLVRAMKSHVGMLLACAAIVLAGCPASEEDSDCDGVDAPAKTKRLGQSCTSFGYGNCPTKFHDCAEGTCEYATGGSICTTGSLDCSKDSDCPSGYFCPRSGTSQGRCSPPKQCSTFCDNGVCCNYSRDPMDPTRCIQGACTVN